VLAFGDFAAIATHIGVAVVRRLEHSSQEYVCLILLAWLAEMRSTDSQNVGFPDMLICVVLTVSDSAAQWNIVRDE